MKEDNLNLPPRFRTIQKGSLFSYRSKQRGERGYPVILIVDNGPELRGRALDAWADDNGVQVYFIDPGKSHQNAYLAA